MNYLSVLIEGIHNLPLLFVFPEVCGRQRWLLTPGGTEREGGDETKPKDSLLHSMECNMDCKYMTFIGALENDNNAAR